MLAVELLAVLELLMLATLTALLDEMAALLDELKLLEGIGALLDELKLLEEMAVLLDELELLEEIASLLVLLAGAELELRGRLDCSEIAELVTELTVDELATELDVLDSALLDVDM